MLYKGKIINIRKLLFFKKTKLYQIFHFKTSKISLSSAKSSNILIQVEVFNNRKELEHT